METKDSSESVLKENTWKPWSFTRNEESDTLEGEPAAKRPSLERDDTKKKFETSKEIRKKHRMARKERKKTEQKGEWTRCQFFLEKKKRFCSLHPLPGSTFCHAHDTQTERKAKRIPCPLDPNHSIYEKDLKKHLKICNKHKLEASLEDKPYYSKGVNFGEIDETETSKLTLKDIVLKYDINFEEFSAKIESLYDEHIGDLPREVIVQEKCVEMIEEAKAKGAKRAILRHLIQQASIVGHMEKVGLTNKEQLFLELGSGRGTLSLALQKAVPQLDAILIDRAAVRRKTDAKLRESGGRSGRVRIDIQDLDLKKLPDIQNRCIVGCGKHLCGVGSDFALRCMAATFDSNTTDEEGPKCHVDGIAIASCCHHVCFWNHYVGRDYFTEVLNISPLEFDLMRRVASWAVCGIDAEARKKEAKKAEKEATSEEKGKEAEEVEEVEHKVNTADVAFDCKLR
eukprot:TRINITY_DN5433_c0_g2_i1.p1 TRINITY_DN5433_c0_g2~~TRINITY_DN5433_c0_g2_i1.p1  ORF type:complete len:455 (+),score=154.22 TRINITY_DN5433_c0_g2_i1:46-1410(+)